jgi:hypothetical protein
MAQNNVLPTDTTKGSFEGRETELKSCDCGCGRATAFFTDTGEVCVEQTVEVRGDDTGFPTLDQFEEALEAFFGLLLFESAFSGDMPPLDLDD